MIKIGFLSAILADQSCEQVVSFAAKAGYSCVEIMCWPVGKAERRYAGVTHIIFHAHIKDIKQFGPA